jgi:deoxyribodipyrimidine photo-lyase
VGKKRAILWFRQDLRLHDNEALCEAMKSADEIIPLYIFDERVFKGKSSFGFHKTGLHRTNFILESIEDLRQSLRELGSELYVRSGKPEDVIFSLARESKCAYTFCNRERTREEVAVQDALEQNLWTIGREVRYSRGKMLYYTADLPFPVNHTPDQFSVFKKEVQRIIPVRDLINIEANLAGKTYKGLQSGEIPALEDLCPSNSGTQSEAPLRGGEMNGLNQLSDFIWRKNLSSDEKNSHLASGSCSSFLSPYLAQGCLSPKKIYHELKAHEQQNGGNEDSNGMFYHLIYRDFLRLMAKKYNDRIFQYNGIKERNFNRKNNDWDAFNQWASGTTGNSFVDANMTQLNKTGMISFQGRETVATYLVYELELNWQMGAEYFESQLLDYDPCSNWVNWNNIAGVGVENREKALNSQTAGRRFDPSGEYVKQWLI